MRKLSGFAGLLLLAFYAPVARGDIQLSYQLDAGPQVVCASNGSNTFAACAPVVIPVTGGNVTITQFEGASNSPGGPSGAFEFGSTLSVINSGTTAQTLTLWIAAQDFTSPTTPPDINFFSNLSGTHIAGVSVVGLTSCVDTTNGLAPPTDPFCAAGPTLTNTSLSFSGIGAQSNSVSSVIGSLGAPFSLSQEITIALGAGAALNFDTSTILAQQQIPEPSSIVLFGVILLAASVARRRKLAKV